METNVLQGQSVILLVSSRDTKAWVRQGAELFADYIGSEGKYSTFH